MTKFDWSRLYTAAEGILARAPWKTHEETEIFALQPREHGPIYFASIMGRIGEHFAIAYYPGLESFSDFQLMHSEDVPLHERQEILLLTGHLQVAFEKKKYLLRGDLDALKAAGKNYRGKTPVFRTHRPARMPWTANEEEAQDLAILMEQSLKVLSRPGEKLLRRFESDEFYLLNWQGEDGVCRPSDLPVPQHAIRVAIPTGEFEGLRRSRFQVELGTIVLPHRITDVPPGEPPYFPLTVLMVDAENGMIIGMEMLSTVDGMDAAYAQIPETVLRNFKKLGAMPETIFVKQPIVRAFLEGVGNVCGIKIKPRAQLDAFDEAAEALRSFPG